MANHEGLPVQGYRPQSEENIALVNSFKQTEERILRTLDELAKEGDTVDKRWLAIGRTSLEQAFMAINRAVFQPSRVKLPGDTAQERCTGHDFSSMGMPAGMQACLKCGKVED